MKTRVMCSAALISALLSSTAMAQKGGYFSAAAGFGNVNVDCFGAPSCDRSGTASKMVGGYDFGSGLAAEVGYIDFGKARLSGSALTRDFAAGAITAGVAFQAPLSPAAGVNLRLGLASVKTQLDRFRTDAPLDPDFRLRDWETKAAPYFGLSFNYAINRDIRFEAGVDFSRSEYGTIKTDLRAITFGVRFTL